MWLVTRLWAHVCVYEEVCMAVVTYGSHPLLQELPMLLAEAEKTEATKESTEDQLIELWWN